jgi:DNA-binding GntR family transcriptional regulator
MHMSAGQTMRVLIDHGAAEFPYLQLARIIRERIASGQYVPGQKLPSISAIVGETGLDTMTIRRGMKVLADEGLIEIVKGRGTFVRRA